MYDISLTNIQKLYMINLSDNANMISITQFSELFNCSKVNSKSILDRMVKIGVLYKDKKNYLFTVLGEKIADELVEERNKLEFVLSNLLDISTDKARQYANSIACEAIPEFTDKLSMYYQYCNHNYERGQKIDYKKVEKLLKKGKFKIYFCIYKLYSNGISVGEEFSMANSGFDSMATLVMDDKPHILLYPKNIKKSDKGFLKNGILQNISYTSKNGDVMMEIEDKAIKIPFNILNQWQFIEKNTLQCGIYLNTHTKIGFIEHNKKSLFVFTINLLRMF